MSAGIAYDLWPLIIGYIPVEDLRTISAASPMFDEIIYDAGIRIFYGSSAIVLEIDDHKKKCIIIQGEFGKKDVILYDAKNDDDIISLVYGNGIQKDRIEWTNQPELYEYWHVSLDKKVALSYGGNYMIFTTNISTLYNSEFCMSITNGIKADIDFINFDSNTMVYWDDAGSEVKVTYETFKVIYADGRFL